MDYVESIVPDNFITPFQTANVLSVLLIAAAVGIAIAKMPRESKNQDLMITFFKASQDVLFTLVNWLIVVLPIGILCFRRFTGSGSQPWRQLRRFGNLLRIGYFRELNPDVHRDPCLPDV